jgi:hypothetical protein
MFQRLSLVLLSTLVMSSFALSQADQPQPDRPNSPQVAFELTWRGANPQWFQIAIDSTGRGSYQSQPHTEPNETPGDPYILKFEASEKLRKEVFDDAKALNYFNMDLKYAGKTNIANTGDKILSYMAEGKTTKASYNYSSNPKAQELTKLFQQMSNTFELGRQLDYALRFDKLGVDQKLKQLESLERDRAAPGLPVLVPILERVLNEPTTMNISRQRANFLIYAAKSEK